MAVFVTYRAHGWAAMSAWRWARCSCSRVVRRRRGGGAATTRLCRAVLRAPRRSIPRPRSRVMMLCGLRCRPGRARGNSHGLAATPACNSEVRPTEHVVGQHVSERARHRDRFVPRRDPHVVFGTSDCRYRQGQDLALRRRHICWLRHPSSIWSTVCASGCSSGTDPSTCRVTTLVEGKSASKPVSSDASLNRSMNRYHIDAATRATFTTLQAGMPAH
jgi:hypothetical protein